MRSLFLLTLAIFLASCAPASAQPAPAAAAPATQQAVGKMPHLEIDAKNKKNPRRMPALHREHECRPGIFLRHRRQQTNTNPSSAPPPSRLTFTSRCSASA